MLVESCAGRPTIDACTGAPAVLTATSRSCLLDRHTFYQRLHDRDHRSVRYSTCAWSRSTACAASYPFDLAKRKWRSPFDHHLIHFLCASRAIRRSLRLRNAKMNIKMSVVCAIKRRCEMHSLFFQLIVMVFIRMFLLEKLFTRKELLALDDPVPTISEVIMPIRCQDHTSLPVIEAERETMP